MRFKLPRSLVETSFVLENLNKLIPIDASWHMPSTGRNARTEFEQLGRLKNARFFDIDAASDKSTSLPHMLPKTSQEFNRYACQLGIETSADPLVIYDNSDVASAYRVYWTFKVFGHSNVAIMNGGLSKWVKENLPVVKGTFTPPTSTTPTMIYKQDDMNTDLVCSYDEVMKWIGNPAEYTIIDARSVARFEGTQPEPRPGLKSGHMPNAVNLPFSNLLDPLDKTLLPVDQLKLKFKEAGIPIDDIIASNSISSSSSKKKKKAMVFSCGSGVTASVVWFAAERMLESVVEGGSGSTGVALKLYDGSWSEYGSRNESPVVYKS